MDDLCGLAARRDPLLSDFSQGGQVRVAACYPRAVRWLFFAGGAPLEQSRTKIVNLRIAIDLETAARALLASEPSTPVEPPGETVAPAPASSGSNQGASKSWFPVIDFDRCNHCMQCLNFCLFGVFAVNAQKQIAVTAPANCKVNCPACSRVCPEAAIIFPKYSNSPINGDEVRASDLERESMKADLSGVLGGDLYSTLRRRNGSAGARFSKDRDPAQALKERQAYLAALGNLNDIPPEVVAAVLRETVPANRTAK